MKILLTSMTTLLAAAFFQAPTTPPEKMGLWEENTTLKMQQPDGTDRITSQKLRICITPSNWLRLMGPTAKGACPKTNELWSKNSYSFDVACAGKPKQASVAIHFDSPKSQHGGMDDYETPDGKPMKMHAEFEGHWVSAACGDVSTEDPVIVR
jgi:hypothetical protein